MLLKWMVRILIMLKLNNKLQNLNGDLLRAGSGDAPEVNGIYLTHLNKSPFFI